MARWLGISASFLLIVVVVCRLLLPAALSQNNGSIDSPDIYFEDTFGVNNDSIDSSDIYFEDTFGVGLDTVLKVILCVLIIVAIINTQLWSVVSWFVQFKRMFAICFFISVVWNWFYLYKIAVAEHQNNIVKMSGFSDKCTGITKKSLPTCKIGI